MNDMYPYEPVFAGTREVRYDDARKSVLVTGPAIVDHETGRTHPRPFYTDVELANLCRWLNERRAGYPVKWWLTD